jgi:uncharacterized protein with HEPN domain
MRSDRDRLEDILEAIKKIREKCPATPEELFGSELLHVWTVYHLQVIGEAANNLSPEIVAAHQEVPWRRIVAARNILVHHYFGIDEETVWTMISVDLPALEASVGGILEGLP